MENKANKVKKADLLQVEVMIHQVALLTIHLMIQAVKVKDNKEEEKNQEM